MSNDIRVDSPPKYRAVGSTHIDVTRRAGFVESTEQKSREGTPSVNLISLQEIIEPFKRMKRGGER